MPQLAVIRLVPSTNLTIPIRDYDLSATLSSGQAFRWRLQNGSWHGIIGRQQVRLRSDEKTIVAETDQPQSSWTWLTHYLQTDLDLNAVIATFPDDPPMRAAVNACRGLRLLRQDPWECLASFILSSTKQIVQIQQIVATLCQRFTEPIVSGFEVAPSGGSFGEPAEAGTPYQEFQASAEIISSDPVFAFPSPERLARATESELRACKMGFRAPYLLDTARRVAEGRLNLEQVGCFPIEAARAELLKLSGVGRKIADCVLLFAYGYPTAFPVDVWVMKALRQLYFPKRRPSSKRLRDFSETHFGPNAGYAQQYLFHYMRTQFRKRS